MNIPRHIQALLFDLGGVVLRLDWERMYSSWAADSSLSCGEIRRRFQMDSAYKQHETGALSSQAYFAGLKRKLEFSGDDQAFIKGWNALFVGEIEETVKLISVLSRDIPVYLLTNSNPTHESAW